MNTPRFQRRIEDFVCGHCGANVAGDGFTNHCPKCLWSRHVDINPGDRAAHCGGLMEPVGLEGKTGEYKIVHRCTKCGTERRNLTSDNDDSDSIVAIAERRQMGNN